MAACPDCGTALDGAVLRCPECGGSPPAARSWLVGSGPDCDVVVRAPVVSAHHCRLTRDDGHIVLEDLRSTNGTYVDGRRIESPVALQPAQTVTLGRSVPFRWLDLIEPASRAGARTVTIGRSPENDVVLDFPTVSARHARLTAMPDGTSLLEDLGSTNGIAVNVPGRKVQRAVLKPDDRVFFGSYPVPAARLLGRERATLGARPRNVIQVRQDRSVLGRDPGCDIPLPFPSVSWRHAELVRTSKGMEVRDLRSLNGTFVNGERVSGRRLLKSGDVLSLGSIALQLAGEAVLERRDYKGNVTIEATALSVDAARGVRLLDGISLTVFPSEMVAFMGPSGAGKTTLLKALNGYTVPSSGAVLFNGNDLYAAFDTYRLELGYVPQDDIIHSLLTVREALWFTALLRTDLRPEEIRGRIDEVLATLDIAGIRDKLIGSPERKVISGGQRKRVNIAMELLCDPTVLFLDEPTSGLSSSDSLKVVQHLRRLADQGKTVLMTIHQPGTRVFRLFDDVAVVSRDSRQPARLVYFGPAYPESVEFFNPGAVRELQERIPGAEPAPDLLFEGLESGSTAGEWADKYAATRFSREYVEERRGTVHSAGHAGRRAGQRVRLRQLRALVHRNLLLKLRDRLQTGLLVLQAPGFAFLVWLALQKLRFHPETGNWIDFTSRLSSVHFLMVIAAIWFGCNNAVREIVGEWSVFEREQTAGLKIPLYLCSKALVLGGVCVFQCLSLLGIIYYGCGLEGSFWRIFLVLLLLSTTGVAIGLAVSARFKTTDSALATLPLVLLPMIVLGGGLQPVYTMNAATQAICLLVPSRWGFEANLLVEAQAQPSHAFNPCRAVVEKAEQSARDAVLRTQRACEEHVRAEERRIRERFGILSGLLPAPARIEVPKPPAAAGAAQPVPVRDIAEAAFPASPARPAAVAALPARTPYRAAVAALAAFDLVFMGMAWWMLRRRVVH